MTREEVKELIEQYKSDGFNLIDITLKDKNTIQINESNEAVFSLNFLTISNPEYLFHIRYSAIKEISI